MTLETGKPIGKIFSTNFIFKGSFTSLLFWAYSNIPFSETIPFFLLDHSKIRRIRPLQEVQDIGQLRLLWNKEDFYRALQWRKLQRWRLQRLGEFEGFEEFPDLYELGRHPLWNLADYGSCQYPRSRCIGERPEHGELRTQSFVKKTLRQEISTMEDSSWQWQGQKHSYPWCHRHWYYGHRAELSMHFFGGIGW